MIELSRRQLDFGDGLIAEEVSDLWEDWMRCVDTFLDDPNTLARILAGQRPRMRKLALTPAIPSLSCWSAVWSKRTRTIRLAKESLIARAYGSDHAIEGYRCRYGVAKARQKAFARRGSGIRIHPVPAA
ncbi:MAG TPA: hypothetical protein VFY73_01875 [Ideonella sp.]|uniref:hypothetical protein n=1 Tax=Ideonella sp. TaxID=1929293 RepID=UPI002E3395EB|nr:hypothetical protein [Ideonella sp.]HEX5682758.1 hypothetical protein [Ideonella sp.]